ncbi:MAG TPA: cytochrome P450 [Acidimicrobiia bacterium]|nr:cytochrome P450 [Acidimicrobiia bacterium]
MADTSYHHVRAEAHEAPPGCPVNHEFTPLDPAYMADPYTMAKRFREESPVFYAEQFGYVVVTRMEDISEVFRDHETYSSENVQDPVFPIGQQAQEILAAPDFDPIAVMSNRQPPDHGRIRKHTRQLFSVRRMKTLEPYIRRRCHELIDDMLEMEPPVDFVTAFTHPLSGEVIFRFIGFPEDMDTQLKAWTTDRLAFTWGKPSPEQQVDIARKMLAYYRYCKEYTAYRDEHAGDDIATELLAAHHADPEDLTYREVVSVLYGLSFAGHEIVANLFSNCLLTIQPGRADWDALCADPALIPNAVEEVIRINSPQIGWRRVTTRATTLGGIDIPAGTQVFLYLGAANHQPSEFPDPETYDMHRDNARKNISFGKGIHLCLGANLARLEGKVVLEVLTERLPGLRLVPDQEIERYPNLNFRGPRRLLITLDG